MKWLPWKDCTYDIEAKNEGEPINDPPCKHCVHWNPQVQFNSGLQGLIYDGVRLCHSDDMEHDFSCFTDPAELKE